MSWDLETGLGEDTKLGLVEVGHRGALLNGHPFYVQQHVGFGTDKSLFFVFSFFE